MTTKQDLLNHFVKSRENLTPEAKADISAVVDIFWDDIFMVDYGDQESANLYIKEGIAGLVVVVDAWGWSEAPSSHSWVSGFVTVAMEMVKPVAKEFVKIGMEAGIAALKDSLA